MTLMWQMRLSCGAPNSAHSIAVTRSHGASINQEVIQRIQRNNLRIGDITDINISSILTCFSLSD